MDFAAIDLQLLSFLLGSIRMLSPKNWSTKKWNATKKEAQEKATEHRYWLIFVNSIWRD